MISIFASTLGRIAIVTASTAMASAAGYAAACYMQKRDQRLKDEERDILVPKTLVPEIFKSADGTKRVEHHLVLDIYRLYENGTQVAAVRGDGPLTGPVICGWLDGHVTIDALQSIAPNQVITPANKAG